MIIGPSYNLDIREVDVQRTINMFPVNAESSGEVDYLDSIPGLVQFSVVGVYYLLQENGEYILQENTGRFVL